MIQQCYVITNQLYNTNLSPVNHSWRDRKKKKNRTSTGTVKEKRAQLVLFDPEYTSSRPFLLSVIILFNKYQISIPQATIIEPNEIQQLVGACLC